MIFPSRICRIYTQYKCNKMVYWKQIQMDTITNLLCCCSNAPRSGQYAFEAYRKLPLVGGLLDKFQGMSSIFGNQGTQPSKFIPRNVPESSVLINNTPLDVIKATDNNLEQITANNSNTVIKKVLKSNYQELITKHRESGQKFTDPDFPPVDSSIGNVEDLNVKASWRRIPDVIKRAKFVQGTIQPSDVLQGSIGDCYFLSAIAALAEKDYRIKNIFPNLQMNPNGIYMARMLHNGVLKEVVVDDFIPVNEQNDPLFARPANGNEIWVMILEKCWAKVHGSYGAIVGGLPNQVLHAFSGAPAYYRPVPDSKEGQDELWQYMFKSHEEGAVLCCGTKGDETVEKNGFVPGHAYTLIDLYEQPYKMAKLRNPWGQKEWIGRASDGDSNFWNKISPADKQKLEYKQKNDGIFFMLWQDFVGYFDMVDVCPVNDNANYLNVDSSFNRHNGEMFDFQMKSRGNVVLTFAQDSIRGREESGAKVSRTTMILGRYDDKADKGQQYTYVKSSSSKMFSEHNLAVEGLAAGKYVIFAKADWVDKELADGSISAYTDSACALIKTKQSSHKQFLAKVFLDHARKNSKKQSVGDKDWICSDLLLGECAYGYHVVHLDEKSTRKIGVEINESDYINKRLTLKKPYKGKGLIKAAIEPGKELVVIFKVKSNNLPTSINLPTPKFYNLA